MKSSSVSKAVQQKSTESQNANTSAISTMRKKEKELEKKLKDQDSISSENKKYMVRLQELNAKLLNKIKELEEENGKLRSQMEIPSAGKEFEEENIQ